MRKVRRVAEGYPLPELQLDEGDRERWMLELDLVPHRPGVLSSRATIQLAGWTDPEYDAGYWRTTRAGLQSGVWFEVQGLPPDVDLMSRAHFTVEEGAFTRYAGAAQGHTMNVKVLALACAVGPHTTMTPYLAGFRAQMGLWEWEVGGGPRAPKCCGLRRRSRSGPTQACLTPRTNGIRR